MPERRHCRHCLGGCPGDCLIGSSGRCIHGWNGKHSRQFTWQLLLTRKWWHRVFRGEGGLMLLSFRVANVLSFRDEQSLFFVATEFHDGPALPTEVREQGKKIAVLPVLGIYGANASGRAIGRPSGPQRLVRASCREARHRQLPDHAGLPANGAKTGQATLGHMNNALKALAV